MPASRTLRIGTRASKLATWQASWVADQLRAAGRPAVLEFVRTHGDVSQTAIVGGGETGVFTRELQEALLDHRVDLAVHSLKDLPTASPDGLVLAAVPLRASPFDALISQDGMTLDALPSQSRLGTGSSRRKTQILYARPDLVVLPVRGNVDTRLGKLDAGEYDALVLAEAGLERLGLAYRISQRLPPEVCLPAPAQGALGIEARGDDEFSRSAAGFLNHAESAMAVAVERSFLAAMQAGCSAPLAAWCRITTRNDLQLRIAILNNAATERLTQSFHAAMADAADLGLRAANWVLNHGAADWR